MSRAFENSFDYAPPGSLLPGGPIPGPKIVRHPFRRVSDDEMDARGMCDIMDPDAALPTHCSVCKRPSAFDRPLTLKPVSYDMRAMVRSYLYAAWCADCSIVRIR